MPPYRLFLLLGALGGLLSVAMGAFGAHAMKMILSPGLLDVYNTAVEYQVMHSIALLLSGILLKQMPHRAIQFAGWAFASGILIFSGSLYLLALTDASWLGAITPVGGTAFLIGWSSLAWGVLRAQD